MDGEVEVGSQRLVVTLQVGGRLDGVEAGRQVPLDAGIAHIPTVVVGADNAAGERRQRKNGITVLRFQVDANATGLVQVERVTVGGVLHHEARPARV